jgi:cytochrome c-type biogenesis protein CcmH/NrfG
MEPEAEQTCENLASLAIQSDPENIEALDCLASVRLSQNRTAEAKEAVEKACRLLKDIESGDFTFAVFSAFVDVLTYSCR